MKRFVKLPFALLLALGLGFGGPTLAQDDVFDDTGLWETYDHDYWNSEVWSEDRYGVFDEDFEWGTAGDEFAGWAEDNDWYTYDDVGDEGWFDV